MTEPQAAAGSDVIHLRAAGVSLLLDAGGPTLPRVLHWGRDLGALAESGLRDVADALGPAIARSALDRPGRLPLLATESDGWSGTPGITGHRNGADAHPQLQLTAPPDVRHDPAGGGQLRALTAGSGLRVTVTVTLNEWGVVGQQVEVTNTGEGTYDLGGVLPLLPLPAEAVEVLDLTGRWCRERSPQRSRPGYSTYLRAGRRGRGGHDAPLLLTAGTAGFTFDSGEVWATHAAWSGDTVALVEALPEGAGGAASVIGAGELLRPGEVRLAMGETYVSPTVVSSWSDAGLDGVSDRLHRTLRARPHHPHSPRPVVLNTWEAVYFDQGLDRLTALADVAADVGVERFVLDDGWFGSRRDDTSGLGDWYVSDEAWPAGLGPLFDHVRGLGMQVGLWVEPEMANRDSDLVRAHPDWLLTDTSLSWRNEQALDLARPEVFDHLLERLDTLVGEYRIDYLKWDHNRDLHVARHARPDGVRVPGVHGQTLALYRLLDELRARHPGLEIESCASGGGRVDLGILERTDRVWASDTNDAVERQHVQRWTGLLIPPELVGAHVGPPRAHTTNRRLDLAFRCATALFGHAGLEWDLTTCAEDELATLSDWIGLYKQQRELLHSGRVVRADLVDPGALLHGVVAHDGIRALFAYVRLDTSAATTPGRIRVPGLDPARSYTVRVRTECGPAEAVQRSAPPWTRAPITLPGSVLESVGLPMPVLTPASALIFELSS